MRHARLLASALLLVPVAAAAEDAPPLLTPYGFVKADLSWDHAKTSHGNFVLWSETPDVTGGVAAPELNVSANATRFGLLLSPPDLGEVVTGGRIEVDFWGDIGGTENKPRLRLRQAYLTLTWPGLGLSVLAGQTWDLMSPRNLPSLNFTAGLGVGNLGYRRPQIRLTGAWPVGGAELTLAVAAARSIADASGLGDDGELSGLPTLQARAGLEVPVFGRPASLGVGGHGGLERLEYEDDVPSWSVTVDARLPIADGVALEGEAFVGANLDAYYGGILQGLNDGRAIRSRGGWAGLLLGPFGPVKLHLTGGVDDPEDEDLGEIGRALNVGVFCGGWYALSGHASIGLEGAWISTDWVGRRDGETFRAQTSFLVTF